MIPVELRDLRIGDIVAITPGIGDEHIVAEAAYAPSFDLVKVRCIREAEESVYPSWCRIGDEEFKTCGDVFLVRHREDDGKQVS